MHAVCFKHTSQADGAPGGLDVVHASATIQRFAYTVTFMLPTTGGIRSHRLRCLNNYMPCICPSAVAVACLLRPMVPLDWVHLANPVVACDACDVFKSPPARKLRLAKKNHVANGKMSALSKELTSIVSCMYLSMAYHALHTVLASSCGTSSGPLDQTSHARLCHNLEKK